MKKTILLLSTLLLSLSTFAISTTEPEKSGDLWYKKTSNTGTAVCVTKVPDTASEEEKAAWAALTMISIPQTVEFGGETYTVTGVSPETFQNHANLTSVTIASNPSFNTIWHYAFNGCKKLTSFIMEGEAESDLDIETGAFMNCSALEIVQLAPQTYTIYDKAFYGCTNFVSFEKELFVSNTHIVTIGDSAFAYTGFNNQDWIDFPQSLTTVGKGVLYGCDPEYMEIHWHPTKLKNDYTKPEDAPFYGMDDPLALAIDAGSVQEIPSYLCYGLANTAISLSSGPKKIGNAAFYGCQNMQNSTKHSGIKECTSVGERAFANTNIKTFELPKTETPATIYANSFDATVNFIVIGDACSDADPYNADPIWGNFHIIGQGELKVPNSSDGTLIIDYPDKSKYGAETMSYPAFGFIETPDCDNPTFTARWNTNNFVEYYDADKKLIAQLPFKEFEYNGEIITDNEHTFTHSGDNSTPFYVRFGENVITSAASVTAETPKAVKTLRDGTLLIRTPDGRTFNTLGAEVK